MINRLFSRIRYLDAFALEGIQNESECLDSLENVELEAEQEEEDENPHQIDHFLLAGIDVCSADSDEDP